MSVSRQEEIIGTLWLIAAILCFGFGFTFWGWALLAKAAFDQVAAIVVGANELAKKTAGVKLPPQPDEAREGSQSPDDDRAPGIGQNPSFSKAEGRTP